MLNLPDSPHHKAFAEISAQLARIEQRQATLRLEDASGESYEVSLIEGWQLLPGRPGVLIYHVPHPTGREGLYMAAYAIAPGSEYTGSKMELSRLLVQLQGELHCNGQRLAPSEFTWLAPNAATSWAAPNECIGVVFYGAPNPALTATTTPVS